jgi:hypothetical protein
MILPLKMPESAVITDIKGALKNNPKSGRNQKYVGI